MTEGEKPSNPNLPESVNKLEQDLRAITRTGVQMKEKLEMKIHPAVKKALDNLMGLYQAQGEKMAFSAMVIELANRGYSYEQIDSLLKGSENTLKRIQEKGGEGI